MPKSGQAALLAAFLLPAAGQALAAARDDTPGSKLTLSRYAVPSVNHGTDLNLRHTFAMGNAWIGAYREREGFEQMRAGVEWPLGSPGWMFVPGVQAASHGFAGMSLYGELGGAVHAIAGFGRTNLKPYANLNFDPNDAVQLGIGARDGQGHQFALYAIHDDRLGTGQTNTHLVLRAPLEGGHRLLVDVLRKKGWGDEGLAVKAWSVTVGYDWPRYFVRVAVDPHVNYTAERQTRLAVGLRY